MESMSIWHGLIVLICLLVLGYPIARILKRLGYSAWWVIIAFIPFANFIGLWVLSFVEWPNVPDNR
jgi:ABC-type spermidine/putrescine transport system permease subunit I